MADPRGGRRGVRPGGIRIPGHGRPPPLPGCIIPVSVPPETAERRARPPACTTDMTYPRSRSEKAMPLPSEVQEMTTTEPRKHLPELVNMAAYGHVTTVLTRDGRRLARIVPEEDAWVFSPAWQDKLREAAADVAAGRVRRFESDDEFLAHLDDLDKADG